METEKEGEEERTEKEQTETGTGLSANASVTRRTSSPLKSAVFSVGNRSSVVT